MKKQNKRLFISLDAFYKHVFKWRMDKMNKLNEAVELLGGRPAFCAALEISPQRLWNWIKRGQSLPAEFCPTVERLTNGKIVCEDFWPETDWAYMRSGTPKVKRRANAASP